MAGEYLHFSFRSSFGSLYKSIVQDADLLSVQVKMMNIAIKNGIALDRWCKSVTVMIEKDIGVHAIYHLRIIHLYEADYNLFLKLQWGSRLVRHGEKYHDLNDRPDGYGPCSAQTAVIRSQYISVQFLPAQIVLA